MHRCGRSSRTACDVRRSLLGACDVRLCGFRKVGAESAFGGESARVGIAYPPDERIAASVGRHTRVGGTAARKEQKHRNRSRYEQIPTHFPKRRFYGSLQKPTRYCGMKI